MAVQSRSDWRFTPEDQHGSPTRSGGALPVEASWDIPTVITQQLIDAAAEALPAWREYMAPCDLAKAGHWLAQLGVMCGGPKMTADEAKEKIVAYAVGLQFPAFCFSDKSLYTAAKKFKWFPTFSEVSDWLEAKSRVSQDTLTRLEMLASAQPTKPREPDMVRTIAEATPEQREKHEAEMRKLKAMLADSGVGNSPKAHAARRAVDNRIVQQRAAMAPMIEAARAKFMEEIRDGE